MIRYNRIHIGILGLVMGLYISGALLGVIIWIVVAHPDMIRHVGGPIIILGLSIAFLGLVWGCIKIIQEITLPNYDGNPHG